ncbi:hypothetical protein RCL1_001693 [Eukaryota sp. TZLM3-RCL]
MTRQLSSTPSVLFIGPPSSGVSTIISSLCRLFNCLLSPHGIHLLKINKQNIFFIELNSDITARHLWKHAVSDGVDLICFVIDSADQETLQDAKNELLALLPFCQDTPIILVTNKQDLTGSLTPENILNYFKPNNCCNSITCIPTVGKNQKEIGWNIDLLGSKIVEICLRNK